MAIVAVAMRCEAKPGIRWRNTMRAAACAHYLCRRDVVLLAQRQQLRAHRSRKAGPVEQAEDHGDAEIDDDRRPGDRQYRRQREPQRDRRQRLDDLDQPLAEHVEQAAVISRHAADDDAEHQADADAEQADRQRDARAVDDAAQNVAAEPVGSEQEHRSALGWADEVQAALDQTPELVCCRRWQNQRIGLDLLRVRHVFALQVLHVQLEVEAIHEGRRGIRHCGTDGWTAAARRCGSSFGSRRL